MIAGTESDAACWLWTKKSTGKREDSWEERLSFLPAGSFVMISHPGSRALIVRAYVDEETGQELVRQFGGKLRELQKTEWNRELEREQRPLRVRNRLVIFTQEEPWKNFYRQAFLRKALLIQPSMAFGTGSHPTTAGCLRLLADVAENFSLTGWHLADLGTGSGILALAGRCLGATYIEAIDYDPVCIREVQRNARINGIQLDQVRVCDVLKWEPQSPFHVITANLFSDTLIAAAAKLRSALLPEGSLIFSGVLREQQEEVEKTFAGVGLRIQWGNRRGKWVYGLARKTA